MTGRAGADLHVHSTHSDGTLTPADVVRAAAAVGLRAVAITDHERTTPIAPALCEAARLGVELIPGVEWSVTHRGRDLDLLGHFVRPDNPALAVALHRLAAERNDRAEAIAAALTAAGLRIDLPAIRAAALHAGLGRPHFAAWLVRTGQAPDRRSAFDRWLADGRPGGLPKSRRPADEVASILRAAGGAVALAHPPLGLHDVTLRELAGLGLSALEIAGRGARRLALRAAADRCGLVPIEGSDFHAHDRPGCWVGSRTTPDPDLERYRARVA